MKVLFFLWLFSISSALAQQSLPDSLWPELPTMSSTGGGRFEDMYFLSKTFAYGIEYSGILHTANNGITSFHPVLDTNNKQITGTRCIGFHTAAKGWIGTLRTGHVLLKTNDSGKTWHDQLLPDPKPAGICGMSIVNDHTMCAAGAFDNGLYDSTSVAVFIRTTDGGESFTSTDMSPYAKSLVDCYFPTETHGFVSGSVGGDNFKNGNAMILETTDGGAHWNTLYRSPRIGEQGWKIYFRTPLDGYVALQGRPNTEKFILKTTDGGAHWSESSLGFSALEWYPEGVCFIDKDHGIAGGYQDTVYLTSDGGDSWQGYNSTAFKGLNRCRRIDDTTAYVISLAVHTFRTQPFSSVAVPTSADHPLPYPNPASDVILIPLPYDGRCSVDILDLSGKLLLSTGADRYLKVRTSTYPNGTYIARVRGHDGIQNIRFVIAK